MAYKDNHKTIRKNAKKMLQKIIDGFISGEYYYYDCYYDYDFQPLKSIDDLITDLNTYNGSYLHYDFEKEEYRLHIHSNNWSIFKSSYKPKKK